MWYNKGTKMKYVVTTKEILVFNNNAEFGTPLHEVATIHRVFRNEEESTKFFSSYGGNIMYTSFQKIDDDYTISTEINL